MKPEIKEQWLKDLRSGNFGQTKSMLKREYQGESEEVGFCCLGVLCEQAVTAGIAVFVPEHTVNRDNDGDGYVVTISAGYRDVLDKEDDHNTYNELLPEFVQRWAGLDSDNPYVNVQDNEEDEDETRNVSLADLNDEDSYNFLQIAVAIENNL